jgi:hypothetical protein
LKDFELLFHFLNFQEFCIITQFGIFFFQFYEVNKRHDHHFQEGLAKFGYILEPLVEIFLEIPSCFGDKVKANI